MEQKDKFAFVKVALAERSQQQRLRRLSAVTPDGAVSVQRQGKTLLNFSANDYLGLSKHPALIAAACEAAQRYGTSATASRLVAGSYDMHQQLEAKLAAASGREAALLFSSGFQANSTILAALSDRQSLVLCDRLAHSSLLQGALASGAKLIRYAHNDLDQLEAKLKESARYSRRVIVSETLFSMDGDCCDVKAMTQLAERYDAILYLDDAHALGVMGQAGMGLAAYQAGVDLTIGTFGKAFGAFGAFVACSQVLRDYLINCCAGFIYTTALPPMVLGSIEAALTLMPELEAERRYLAEQSAKLRASLQALGYDTGASCSQIVPILLGSEARAMALSDWLEAAGILATPIRPPTVPAGSARIRLALSSCHTDQHYDQLLNAIQSWHG